MNQHRLYAESSFIAIAAVAALLLCVWLVKAPLGQTSSQQATVVQLQAAPAAAQTVSTQASGDWLRADAVELPRQQTRWVF
ncbi:hypothetical protein [Phytopseudomonas dryadis]|uniref:Flp pilus assembly protein CpaB n=1 Tax=Phytopseudomonas dryadis TaxID=2487520 RepID=A0ABY1Z049_9GAMM|nr:MULTISPECIES: hypothetical protein [Pseudomonas]TBV00475.1 hypothetical protein DNK34_23285 [Pseudomonas dryadis]TBV13107.1 hypothetical protein DNK41_23205 [Pseudomonas sp. FRB 230]